MAARLLTRSKTLSITARILHPPAAASQELRPLDRGRTSPHAPAAAAGSANGPDPTALSLRGLNAATLSGPLGSPKICSYGQIPPCYLNKSLHAGRRASLRLFSGATKDHVENLSSQFHHMTMKDNTGETIGRIKGVKGADEPDTLNGKDDHSTVISFSPLEGSLTRGRASGLANESLKIKRLELLQKVTYAVIPVLLLVSKTSLTTSLLIFSVFWQIYGFFKEIFLDYVHQEVTRKWVLIYFKLLLLILVKDMILYFGLV